MVSGAPDVTAPAFEGARRAAPAAEATRDWSRAQSPALVALVVAALYLALLGWLWGHFGGDPLAFAHLGTYFTQHDLNGTRGYDGQFYYYAAADPANAAGLLDNASFRLQRIFYPVVIFLVALGQPAIMPYTMLGINWLSVMAGTWIVAGLLRGWGRSPWFALSYALASGVPVALTFDTAEPLTFALVALGVYCWERRRGVALAAEPAPASGRRGGSPLWGALAFAAALLTRELAGFAVAGYAAAAGLRRDKRALAWAILPWLPIVLWSAYLSISTGYLGVSYAQPLEHIPFLAYWLQLENPDIRSLAYAGQYVAPTVVFGALGLLALARTWRAPDPLLIGLLGNVYLLTFLHRGGYLHQVAQLSRYMLGLALAATLWAGRARPRWVLWLTVIFIFSLVCFLYGLVKQDPAYLW